MNKDKIFRLYNKIAVTLICIISVIAFCQAYPALSAVLILGDLAITLALAAWVYWDSIRKFLKKESK